MHRKFLSSLLNVDVNTIVIKLLTIRNPEELCSVMAWQFTNDTTVTFTHSAGSLYFFFFNKVSIPSSNLESLMFIINDPAFRYTLFFEFAIC